jgi:hypothetical protein
MSKSTERSVEKSSRRSESPWRPDEVKIISYTSAKNKGNIGKNKNFVARFSSGLASKMFREPRARTRKNQEPNRKK